MCVTFMMLFGVRWSIVRIASTSTRPISVQEQFLANIYVRHIHDVIRHALIDCAHRVHEHAPDKWMQDLSTGTSRIFPRVQHFPYGLFVATVTCQWIVSRHGRCVVERTSRTRTHMHIHIVCCEPRVV